MNRIVIGICVFCMLTVFQRTLCSAASNSVVVKGMIESTTGGFKFPDATTQTTAGISQTAGDARYLQLTGGTMNTGHRA